jgi:hypothetical protein
VTNVCYIDASLRTNVGHHANSCRHIVGELRRRNLIVDVYGNRALRGRLARDLGAKPFFRHAVYDPITAVWPSSTLRRADYLLARASFLSDLRRCWRRGPYDLVFINSVLPAQFAGLAMWMRAFLSSAMPTVAVEFGTPSGNAIQDGYLHGWWRQFPDLYRQAAGLFDSRAAKHLFLFSFDEAASVEYTQLLKMPVKTMPPVHAGLEAPRLRRPREDGRITLSFLGHQRAEKGYQLVPEIIRQLRKRAVPVSVLVHNGDPEGSPTDRELKTIATSDLDMKFERKPADVGYWQDLLDRSDMIVLPYEPSRYRASYSAIAVEAASQGIPMVVPAGTTMESLAETWQSRAVTFSAWEPKSIADAIEAGVSSFEDLAPLAAAGAADWQRVNGVQCFVETLFQVLPRHSAHLNQLPYSAGNLGLRLALNATFGISRIGVRVFNGALRSCRFLFGNQLHKLKARLLGSPAGTQV